MTLKDTRTSPQDDEPWDEEMIRRADPGLLESSGYYRTLARERRRYEQAEAQRKENRRLILEKEAAAKRFVDHWTLEIWKRIICGDYPPEFARYSPKRIGVLERASMISIDAVLGNRPTHPDAWSREALEARIAKLKEQRESELEAQRRWEERRQSEPTYLERLDAERQSRERVLQLQAAELSLPPLVRELRKKIRELSAIIASKQAALYTDTRDEQSHDRLYATLQQDSETLAALQRALAEAESVAEDYQGED